MDIYVHNVGTSYKVVKFTSKFLMKRTLFPFASFNLLFNAVKLEYGEQSVGGSIIPSILKNAAVSIYWV